MTRIATDLLAAALALVAYTYIGYPGLLLLLQVVPAGAETAATRAISRAPFEIEM